MCRILAIKNTSKLDLSEDLKNFSQMCRKSRTIEGDRQSDGWGVAWLGQNGEWQTYHSLKPLWREQKKLLELAAEASQVAVHARSASFDDYKDDISVNQPYFSGKNNIVFAFNGVVYGVKLRGRIPGKIGAQKIFNLLTLENEATFIPPSMPRIHHFLRRRDKKYSNSQALSKTFNLIKNNSEKIKGFNCVLLGNGKLTAVSDYTTAGDYFKLYNFVSKEKTMICSESIGEYEWELIPKREVVDL